MRSVSYGVYISTSFVSLPSVANAESLHVESGNEVKNPLYVYARRIRRSSQIVHNNFRGPESGKERKPRLENKVIPIKHNTYNEEGEDRRTEMGHGEKVCTDI